jgi:hypothetical protein
MPASAARMGERSSLLVPFGLVSRRLFLSGWLLRRKGRPVAAMNVDRRLTTGARGESTDQLSVAHYQFRSAGVVVALGSALALAPRCLSANLGMMAFRNTS